MKKYIPTLCLIGLLLYSCKPEDKTKCYDPLKPGCENYNPCLGKDSVNAHFLIEQWTGPGNQPDSLKYVAEDSLFYANIIRFTALEENADYTWYLGREKLNDKQFERSFKDVQPPQVIGVSLVVNNGLVDAECFPNDDGRDSVYREFKIVEVCDLLIANKFKGVFEKNPKDSVIIELTAINPQTGLCEGPWTAINFNGKASPLDTNSFFGYHFSNTVYYFVGTGSADPNGILKINAQSQHVDFEYRYYSVDRKFHGKILKP